MRICFFGSEDFSIPSLKSLIDAGHEVVCVVTRANKVKGRGLNPSSTIVASFAEKAGIPVLKPENLACKDFIRDMYSYKPELSVISSYGKILKSETLLCPVKGCINVHPSLLPKYRGATPIESAIAAGDTKTGVTIFYMDEGCDTGDIILQREFPIEPSDNRGTMRKKLASFGAEVLIDAVEMIEKGRVKPFPQPDSGIENTSRISEEDLNIDWNDSAENIINRIRSLAPEPAARTCFRNKRVHIIAASVYDTDKKGMPGTILDIVKNKGLVVACGKGRVFLEELKPEAKNKMSSWAYCCGFSPKPGELFGDSERMVD